MISLALLFAPTSSYGLYTYGWPTGTSGLSFLGVGSGILLGSLVSTWFSNRAYLWMNKKLEGRFSNSDLESTTENRSRSTELLPEGRMFMLQIGVTIIPIGLIIFAWTAGRTHWIAPLIGASIFAAGFIIIYVSFQIYLVDIFGRFAASALATATILRSALGCVFTVIGFQLYKTLDYSWGTMILAFLCIALLPLPVVLTIYGPRLRKKEIKF
jgi:hypothetical protein